MNIIYEDEYGSGVYRGASTHPANLGDTVIVEDEEYRVKSRTFYPEEDKIVITITQNMVKATVAESNNSGRLNEMHNAIMQINKRQDAIEKKSRALNEQIVTVRKHVNQQIQQERKET